MPEDEVIYPKITFKRSEVADELGTVVEKTNYNFDQIAMFSDLVKPRKVLQGERGIPGATGIGEPGEKGERGSVIHYSGISIPDGAPVSDPEHIVNDTIIDSVPKFMQVTEDGLGNKFYSLQLNLAAILTTDYLVNQFDYLTSSGTAITTYIQRNWSGSPSPGDPGSENLALVKRVDDNISEFYRLMVGTDRYLNDPTDISLYLVNILPESGITATDPSLPQFSQIGLKYRPDASNNMTVNTVFMKYHEKDNKWVYSLINSGVGMYAVNNILDSTQNKVILRGRKTQFVGNTANIDPINIISRLEVDVNTVGAIIMNANANLTVDSDATLYINGDTEVRVTSPLAYFNTAIFNVNAPNAAISGTLLQLSTEVAIMTGQRITLPRTGITPNRFALGRVSPAVNEIFIGNAADELQIYGTRAVSHAPLVPLNGINSNAGMAMLSVSGSTVIVGATTASIQLRTAANDVLHNRAGTSYRVWDEYNMGAGNGLDADTVDTLHASQFIRSDVGDEFVGTLTYTPDVGVMISFDALPFVRRMSAGGGAIIGAGHATAIVSGAAGDLVATNVNFATSNVWLAADYHAVIMSNLQSGWANRRTLQFSNSGILTLEGNVVWHAGNDGSGSTLDADTVDALHANQFIRSDADDTFTGILTFTQKLNHNTPIGTVMELGGKAFVQRLTSAGGAAIGADDCLVLGSGEAVAVIIPNITTSAKIVHIASDNIIKFYSNLQPGWASRKEMTFNTAGDLLIGADKVWHQGNMSHDGGLDADLLDGQHGSYYRNATNLNTGTVNINRLPGRLVTKVVTIGFRDHDGPLGGLTSDYYLYVESLLGEDIQYINIFTIPARSKVIHAVLRITQSIDFTGSWASFASAVGYSGDTDKYIATTYIENSGQYAEQNQASIDMVARQGRLRVNFNSYDSVDWQDIIQGQFELGLSYIQYG